MRRYETTFIIHPDLLDDDLQRIVQKAVGVIESHQGDVLQVQDWGKKRLAYKIKKQSRGHYIFIDYLAAAAAVKEVERVLRLDDNVLRFLTVMVDEDVDPKAVRSRLSHAEAEAPPAEEESPEEPAELALETAGEEPESTQS